MGMMLRFEPEFKKTIESLKRLVGEKTATKAILFAIEDYPRLKKNFLRTQKELKIERDKVAVIKKHLQTQRSTEMAIEKWIEGKNEFYEEEDQLNYNFMG